MGETQNEEKCILSLDGAMPKENTVKNKAPIIAECFML